MPRRARNAEETEAYAKTEALKESRRKGVAERDEALRALDECATIEDYSNATAAVSERAMRYVLARRYVGGLDQEIRQADDYYKTLRQKNGEGS